MANERFPVLNKDGGEVLPITGSFSYTADMSNSQNNNCQVYIEFFSDKEGKVPASPTAGSITCHATPMGSVWLAPSNGATRWAKDVQPEGNYVPYTFTGRMQKGRTIFIGILGAEYARITFWRF